MSKPTLLTQATLVDLDPPGVSQGSLRIRDGRIVERIEGEVTVLENETVVDLEGDLLLPGLVNAHNHFYSALVPGMSLPEVPGFDAALEKIWWVVDRCHDVGTIRASAMSGCIEALRCGTTTVIDHHASPSCIAGSLDAVAEGAATIGVRVVTGYEITDRNHPGEGLEGLQENLRALAAGQGEHFGVLTALHASFTLEDETLARVGAESVPVHVHVAEGRQDVEDARRRGYRGVIDRLNTHGLLREGSVLVHGVHLEDEEVAQALESGCWLVHNPSSNRNNRVGYARPQRFQPRLALGTDGIGSDMLGAVRETFLTAREHRVSLDPVAALVGGHRIASELLGVPMGRLQDGHVADLVRIRRPVRGPVNSQSLVGHLLFSLSAKDVRDVWVGGVKVLEEGRVLGATRSRLDDICAQAGKLWAAYERGV
ncbi:MAG: amidohydrolase family protein [Myxococcota bacterium]|nr:amidohydrolase family protein [Myxococcota bacterium]